MEKVLIGFFDLVAFNGKVYPFLVYNDKTMDCPLLNIEKISKLYLKPRFEIETDGVVYKLSSQMESQELIGGVVYDEDIFAYLYDNEMISFSTDVAYLYDLPIKEGFDYEQKRRGVNSGTPYKWASKKGPILTRQKSGDFY